MARTTKAATRSTVRVATRTPVRSATPPPEDTQSWPELLRPVTMEERLQNMATMLERLTGYVKYMSKAATLTGPSAEAKEKAVIAFYERMVILERQLGRIQEELRLG